MKKISILLILLSSIVFANDAKEILLKKQIEKEIQKEKKYAQEQRFYQGDEYNLKASEVNPESLKYINALEVDDLDMDNVYD